MSPITYKFLHILSILMVMLSFGVLIARARLAPENTSLRKFGSIISGIGLLLLLVSGFGLLAKVHTNTFHPFVIAKIVIWVAFGGLTAVLSRKPQLSMPLFWVTLILGVAAAYLGIYKPGL